MRSLLLTLPLLTACAHAPAPLEAAKASVDNRLEYAYFTGNNRPDGLEPHQTNCVGFSKAYTQAAKEKGFLPVRFNCRTPRGEVHQAVQVGEWVLDNRYTMVVPMQGYDCKPI